MAIKYLSNISLEGNELQNVKIHPVGTAPSNGQGKLYYDTDDNKLYANDGSNWYSINGSVEDVTSGNTNLLTIGGTTAAPEINIVTQAPADGGTGLTTSDQVFDYVATQIGNIPSETVTSISIAANVLTYTDENGNDTDIDLSTYLDDTNLARLTSGSINSSTGVATFTRDDSTTFDIDMSAFLDAITLNDTLTSTSTTEGLTANQGKVLKDLIDALPTENTQLEDADIAAMGYIKDYTVTSADVTAHEGDLTVDYSQLTNTPSIPTNNNQLTNGANYITGVNFDEIGGTQSDLNLSDFNNDLVLAPSNAEQNVQSDWDATSGDAFIQNKPTIPTNNNQLTNGEGYITDYTVTSADVTAHEGDLTIDYSQLTGTPSITGEQTLSISDNTLTISGTGGNSIDIYDQTLNTTDDVEFNDIVADKIYLDPDATGSFQIGKTLTAYSTDDAASGNKAGIWNQIEVTPSSDSTSYASAAVNMAKLKGTNEVGTATGLDNYARYEGSGGLQGGLYAGVNNASYRGTDPNSANGANATVQGVYARGEAQSGSTGNIEYMMGANIQAQMDGSGSVDYLQGAHIQVGLTNGTVNDDVNVALLDLDQTGGTIAGDFAYLRIQNDSVTATGDKYAIDSRSTLDSKFAGDLESTGFVKTGGTSSQFLKADGSVDSNAYITGYTVTSADVTAHEGDITITESQISDLNHFSGSYNDLTDTPTIPTINAASTTQAGITEYATATETTTGTVANRAVTVQGLHSSLQTRNNAHHVTASVGNGSDTTITVAHNFGTTKFMTQLVEVSTGDTVYAEITNRTTSNVDVVFASAPASGAYELHMIQMAY